MNKHIKIFLGIIISIIIIGISNMAAYFAVGSVVNTGEVGIKNVTVNDETMQISGTTYKSSKAFTGYNYMIKNDTLYFKLRYSIVNPIHNSGDFNITLNKNLGYIKNIYLQGNKTEDHKLVWTK